MWETPEATPVNPKKPAISEITKKIGEGVIGVDVAAHIDLPRQSRLLPETLPKIAALADDLAMAMEAMRVRIVAPIPGKNTIGIEVLQVDSSVVTGITLTVRGEVDYGNVLGLPHLFTFGKLAFFEQLEQWEPDEESSTRNTIAAIRERGGLAAIATCSAPSSAWTAET